MAKKDNVYSVKNLTLLFYQYVCKQMVPWSTLVQPERDLGVEKGETQLAVSRSPDTSLP